MSGGDFLGTMAALSAARAGAARARESDAAIRERALATPPAPALRFDPSGFDHIAELKRRAPSLDPGSVAAVRSGAPDAPDLADPRAAAAQARLYAAGGACAVSVLTEPERFGGDLADLVAVAGAIAVPAMRKDFLVAPYQVYEARAAGAGGVLLILRMLDDARLGAMLDAAAECGLFALLEAFDRRDLERARALPAVRDSGRREGARHEGARRAEARAPRPLILFGVNTRDLTTLEVDTDRLAALGTHLPSGGPAVAESGLDTPGEAAAAARLGYRMALVGGALMRAADPATRLREFLAAGRAAIAAREAAR
jgi:indole-3-glycerol phosphate synthase